MKSNRFLMLGGVGVLAAAIALAVALGTHSGNPPAGTASSQQAVASSSQPPAAGTVNAAVTNRATEPDPSNQLAVADSAPSAAQNPPGQQGITVHGWWTITVKNPDGSVASQRQFENSLIAVGATDLVHLLMGTSSAGNWAVQLDASIPSDGPCLDQNQNRSACVTVDTRDADTITSPTLFKTLSVEASSTKASFGGQSSDVLVLSGYVTAGADGNVQQVSTGLHYCMATLAPASCRNFAGTYGFTAATLTSPISVIKDQQIAVKVVISFS